TVEVADDRTAGRGIEGQPVGRREAYVARQRRRPAAGRVRRGDDVDDARRARVQRVRGDRARRRGELQAVADGDGLPGGRAERDAVRVREADVAGPVGRIGDDDALDV